MIDYREGRLWQKLKELTEEPDLKEVILNLVVKEEEELSKLGKNNPLITFLFILAIFGMLCIWHHIDNYYILFFKDNYSGD